MGGNVRFGTVGADRINLHEISRAQVTEMISKHILYINQQLGLWSEEAIKNLSHLSGSSKHLFDVLIQDDTFLRVKSSVGDIDVQVNVEDKPKITNFLENYSNTDIKLEGYKNSVDQTITLWHFKELDLNIQIDFEYVDFTNGVPSPWASFSHSSPWEDMELGIKGVAHKYILRALLAKDLKEVYVHTKKGYKKIISAEWAFSPSGLRKKLESLEQTVDNIPVFKELKTSDTFFIRDLGIIFETFFDKPPTDKDISCMHSFCGVVNLISNYCTIEQQKLIVDGFVNTLWGNGAQCFYRGNQDRDKEEKQVMLDYICEKLNIRKELFVVQREIYYDKRN